MTGADHIAVFFLSLGVLLAAARMLGELAQRFHQPAVLGEIAAGILLGPTVLGAIAPDTCTLLFPATGYVAHMREGVTVLAVTLFLLVAGMEVDLTTVLRQGRTAMTVSGAGILVPFSVGFSMGWVWPEALGAQGDGSRLIFALFFATALSISALPVIAKTLMDLKLFRTDLGMIVIASAIVQDLIGWIVFAVVLGLMGGPSGHAPSIGFTIGMTLAFALAMMTLVRWLVHRVLPWIQAYASWPAGVLGFAITLAFIGAAATEWLGVHAIFGSFMAGVALGDSRHLRERTRATIDQFVSAVLAPLFFASTALTVDFVANFDLVLVLLVFVVACAGKLLGCGFGARLAGMSVRESWAIGFGMNARGAMEIILASLALKVGLIGGHLFVALVIMALGTSLMSGPLMVRVLKRPRPRRFTDHLRSSTFVPSLSAGTRREAIRELSEVVAHAVGMPVETIDAAVWERERMMPTGLGNGVAAPHAYIAGLQAPIVAVGLAPHGLDFEALDGVPARIVFAIITPYPDDGAQLELIADVAHTFQGTLAQEAGPHVTSYTEFLALVKTEGSSGA